MPKRRNPTRSKPEDAADQPPERAEVERAIEDVLDRLRPKIRRPRPAPPGKPAPKGTSGSRLSLVPDRTDRN